MKNKISIILVFILFLDYVLAESAQTIVSKSVVDIPKEAIKAVSIDDSNVIEIEIKKSKEATIVEGCKNLCGDNICQQVVCMAVGCPCPETEKTCQTDCSGTVTKQSDLPIIQLPDEATLRISPTETQSIVINEKPVKFIGLETIPIISTKVKPTIIPDIISTLLNNSQPVEVEIKVDKISNFIQINVSDQVAITREIIKFENNSLKIETPSGDKTINIMPHVATQIMSLSKVNRVELKIEREPVYEIEGIKKGKLLFIFPVDILTKSQINAENGRILRLEKPWWDFLVFEPKPIKTYPNCGKIICIRYNPVCGIDNKTYICGEADAEACGVKVAYKGECNKTYQNPSV